MTNPIAFTYDVTAAVGQVRLYAGDTDGTALNATGGDRTRTDAEIQVLLQQNGSDVRAAAATLLEARAAEYARQATQTRQGHLQMNLTLRSSKCLEAATALRANVTTPLLQSSSAAPFSTQTDDGTPGSMDVW